MQFWTPVFRPVVTRVGGCTDGQDVAEYAMMLAVILAIVIGVLRMIGSNANVVFSQIASTIQ